MFFRLVVVGIPKVFFIIYTIALLWDTKCARVHPVGNSIGSKILSRTPRWPGDVGSIGCTPALNMPASGMCLCCVPIIMFLALPKNLYVALSATATILFKLTASGIAGKAFNEVSILNLQIMITTAVF